MADSEEFDDGDTSQEGHPENHNIMQLRAKAKRHDEVAEENAKLKRQLALTEAGLKDLGDEKLKALTAVHEGEFDAEALKATAERLGFVQTSTPNEGQQADQPANDLALEATNRITDAMGGSSTGGPDPEVELRRKIAEAKTPAELDAILAQAGRLRQA